MTLLRSRLPRIIVLLVVLLTGTLVTAQGVPASTATVEPPNIVLIITDDQDIHSLPVMRKLMSYPEGSWVNFTNFMVNDSICCPARASILTGQYSQHTGVISNTTGNKLDDSNTLPVWLDQAGYRTGLIGRYLNGFPWGRGQSYVPPGWDYFRSRGSNLADGRTKLAIDFLNTTSSPFFLHLGYNEPHNPAAPEVQPQYANADVYVPDDLPNFNEADMSDKPRWIRKSPLLSQSTIDTWRNERIASQRALLGVDDGMQQIVDTLKANGQLDNTMIIFMGDHGFSWGSHRFIKKHCPYEECIRTPLLIRYPGLGENREETRLVSNVDIASTIAEYAGVIPSLPQDGKSFLSVITDTATDWTEEVRIEIHNKSAAQSFYGIRVPGWKYVEYRNGDRELYDLTSDPYEMENQANKPEYAAKQAELAERLRFLKGP